MCYRQLFVSVAKIGGVYGEISSRLAFCAGFPQDPARAREVGVQSCSPPRARAAAEPGAGHRWYHLGLGGFLGC